MTALPDTVTVLRGSTPSPNPAPLPLPVGLTDAIAAAASYAAAAQAAAAAATRTVPDLSLKTNQTDFVAHVVDHSNPHVVTKAQVGLGNVDNTSDALKPLSTAASTALAGKAATSHTHVAADLSDATAAGKALLTALNLAAQLGLLGAGAANGLATLDSSGAVPLAQIPSSILGDLKFKGLWNASTNSPVIPVAAAGNNGWFYIVQVAGTTTIDGTSSWTLGDWLISDGSHWGKVTSNALVASVAGKTGTVTLQAADITDATSIGRSILLAATAAAAKAPLSLTASDIGAGTFASNMAFAGTLTAFPTNASCVFNLYYDGAWKYAADGAAFQIFAANASNETDVYCAPVNTSGGGAVAPLTNVWRWSPAGSASAQIIPFSDNAYPLGTDTHRWSTVRGVIGAFDTVEAVGNAFAFNRYYSGGWKASVTGQSAAMQVFSSGSDAFMEFYVSPSVSANAPVSDGTPLSLWNNGGISVGGSVKPPAGGAYLPGQININAGVGVGMTLGDSNVGSEAHPWKVTRAGGNCYYQYGQANVFGVWDSARGIAYKYDYDAVATGYDGAAGVFITNDVSLATPIKSPRSNAYAPYIMTQRERAASGARSIWEWIDPIRRYDIQIDASTWDATAALQSAASSGERIEFSNGTFNVNDQISFAQGAKWKGASSTGPVGTRFNFDSASCNMGASGFLLLNHFVELEGMSFEFVQPDTADRASMHQYPPAVKTPNLCLFFKLDALAINRGWTGLDLRGSTGISSFDASRLRVGCFNVGVYLDNQTDFCRGRDWEFWCFGCNANQATAMFNNGGFTAIDAGFTAMALSNIQSFYGRIYCHSGIYGGYPDLSFDGLNLDTTHIRVADGQVVVGSLWGTRDTGVAWAAGRDNRFAYVEGTGQLSIASIDVEAAQTDGSPIVAVYSSGSKLQIGSGVIKQFATNSPFASVDNGLLVLGSGLTLSPGNGSTSRSGAAVVQNSGVLVMEATLDRQNWAAGTVAYFNHDNYGNFVDPRRYKNLANAIQAGFTISGSNNGSYQ